MEEYKEYLNDKVIFTVTKVLAGRNPYHRPKLAPRINRRNLFCIISSSTNNWKSIRKIWTIRQCLRCQNFRQDETRTTGTKLVPQTETRTANISDKFILNSKQLYQSKSIASSTNIWKDIKKMWTLSLQVNDFNDRLAAFPKRF